jgi:hypothetical protein
MSRGDGEEEELRMSSNNRRIISWPQVPFVPLGQRQIGETSDNIFHAAPSGIPPTREFNVNIMIIDRTTLPSSS